MRTLGKRSRMTPDELQDFKNWQVPLPTRDAHGTDSATEPISSHLQKVEFSNWRLKGNKLIADTQFGEYAYLISPDYMMTGTDDNNHPILTKIKV